MPYEFCITPVRVVPDTPAGVLLCPFMGVQLDCLRVRECGLWLTTLVKPGEPKMG